MFNYLVFDTIKDGQLGYFEDIHYSFLVRKSLLITLFSKLFHIMTLNFIRYYIKSNSNYGQVSIITVVKIEISLFIILIEISNGHENAESAWYAFLNMGK